jgi:hypothetical protein
MAAASTILSDLPCHMREAVRFYWQTRTKQLEKQAGSGAKDQGLRSAVTGGAQMDGFISLLTRLVIEAGIFRNSSYARRYELFCHRLVLDRHYNSAAFLLSESNAGLKGDFTEPAADLAFHKLAQLLFAQVAAFTGRIQELRITPLQETLAEA